MQGDVHGRSFMLALTKTEEQTKMAELKMSIPQACRWRSRSLGVGGRGTRPVQKLRGIRARNWLLQPKWGHTKMMKIDRSETGRAEWKGAHRRTRPGLGTDRSTSARTCADRIPSIPISKPNQAKKCRLLSTACSLTAYIIWTLKMNETYLPMLRRTTAPAPSCCGRARNFRTTCRGFSIAAAAPTSSALLLQPPAAGRPVFLCASTTTMALPLPLRSVI